MLCEPTIKNFIKNNKITMSTPTILLTSEKFVKEVTNLSDNLSGKLLLPAIKEAQNFGLRNLVGNQIYNTLLNLVASKEIDNEENIDYKNLLDVAQYYLAYSAATNVIILSAVKIDNIGVVRVTDSGTESVSLTDTFTIRDFYKKKSDYYRQQVSEYLKNSNLRGETSCNTNTYSNSSTNIWLGGPRGKRLI